MTRTGIIQANVNHARHGQDMLMQIMAERGSALAIVAEPYRVPPGDRRWVVSPDGSAAILWRRAAEGTPPISKLEVGRGYVAVLFGECVVVGTYLPPSLAPAEYLLCLEGLAGCVERHAPRPVIVAGDFNAWSPRWGSRAENARGREVLDWAAELDLVLLNVGSSSTCVRPRGESVVDLTWATPAAAERVRRWRVLEEVDTMSDHLYISYDLLLPSRGANIDAPPNGCRPRRWVLRLLDPDLLMAATLASTWPRRLDAGEAGWNLENEVAWLREVAASGCDVAMPRARFSPRRAAYWWSEEIADLRQSTVRARRSMQRARRRGDAREMELRAAYRDARKQLRAAITRSKEESWAQSLRELEEDPWGRPYKLVLDKLRAWAPPTTETADPEFLREVLGELFPPDVPPPRERPGTPREGVRREEREEPPEVTLPELKGAVARMRRKNSAPGPDGVPGRALAIIIGVMPDRVAGLLTECLRSGTFPQVWRQANLVLLPKPGKPENAPSAYRPICLLDDAAKLLERIVADRIVQHLSRGTGPDLSPDQYGFRVGRSTVDAIMRVRTHTEAVAMRGGVCLAVALDISNAFNTLPWGVILGALDFHRVPRYLQQTIAAYLRDRGLRYRDRSGASRGWPVERGVPQGSVLGPLLWNIGFDRVLRTPLPPGCMTVAYADDTLVIAEGDTWGNAIATANVAVAAVVRSIEALGLRVAANKTEAVFFHDGSVGAPPEAEVRVSGTRVPVGPSIKYLGLTVDGRWSFEDHFTRLAPRLEGVASSLGRLLPNIGGPSSRVRRLYEGVVRSIATYAAPVWAGEMRASISIRRNVHRAQRRLALRIARLYRTASLRAATALAGVPPVEILAHHYAEQYRRVVGLRSRGAAITPRVRATLRRITRRNVVEEWGRELNAPDVPFGVRVAQAIGPCLPAWLGRGHGRVSFRLAQILSGHGCFGEYLCRIGKERTAACHQCGAPSDTAQHTLEFCPEWAEQRGVLWGALGVEEGGDLSLSGLVPLIIEDEAKWRALASFAEEVVKAKEEAERVRRGEVDPPSADDEGDGGPAPHANRRAARRRGRRNPPAHLRA